MLRHDISRPKHILISLLCLHFRRLLLSAYHDERHISQSQLKLGTIPRNQRWCMWCRIQRRTISPWNTKISVKFEYICLNVGILNPTHISTLLNGTMLFHHIGLHIYLWCKFVFIASHPISFPPKYGTIMYVQKDTFYIPFVYLKNVTPTTFNKPRHS